MSVIQKLPAPPSTIPTLAEVVGAKPRGGGGRLLLRRRRGKQIQKENKSRIQIRGIVIFLYFLSIQTMKLMDGKGIDIGTYLE